MSIAPGHGVASTEAHGPKGAPFATTGPVSVATAVDAPDGVTIRTVDIIRLQDGDRLLVHVDGNLGLGAGGAHKIATQLNDLLGLDKLGFDVPVCVTAPGLRIEVIRPS